jgi:pimeloyl-ACP methyl ester carboxylesterase
VSVTLDQPPLAEFDSLPALDLTRPPWPGREEIFGGVRMFVRSTPGSTAATALYVHGLGGSATNWTDLAGLLAPRASGLAIDLPGFGFSRPLADPDYSPMGHADALMCFLAGRGEPVHLVGNSFGGVVALTVAARRPELARTLTLISPAVPDRRPDLRRVWDPRIPLAMLPRLGDRARSELAAMSPRARAEQVIRLCFGDPSLATESRMAEMAAEIERRSRLDWAAEAVNRTALAMLGSWFRRELWPLAARVRCPTLVVWGDRDKLMAPRLAPRTAVALRAPLLMLPGVGHVAQIEAPVAVARAVAGMWDAVELHRWPR